MARTPQTRRRRGGRGGRGRGSGRFNPYAPGGARDGAEAVVDDVANAYDEDYSDLQTDLFGPAELRKGNGNKGDMDKDENNVSELFFLFVIFSFPLELLYTQDFLKRVLNLAIYLYVCSEAIEISNILP